MKFKKILSMTLAALLVSACFVFTPAYAASASLSASSTSVTVGDTVTISFSISGSQLGGAQGTFTFSNTGIISAPKLSKGNSWTRDRDSSGNFFSAFGDSISGGTTVATVSFTAQSAGTVTVGITGVEVTDNYDPSYPSASPVTITIKDKPKPEPDPEPDPEPGSRPSGGNNSKPSEGNNNHTSGSSSSTSASSGQTPEPDASSDATLASLQISNAELSPAFRPDVLNYTAIAADDAEALEIQATPNDGNAKVTVSGNHLTEDGTAEIRISVTAENGGTKTYAIHATRAQNAASLSGNNRLSSLTVDTGSLSPAFDPETLNYVVWLPYETEQITVTAEAEDEKAMPPIVEGDGTLKESNDNSIKVTCTAENGDIRIYNIIAKRAIAPQYDPSLTALNPITTPQETVEQIEALGKAYGQGTVTATLTSLDASILQAMKQYPGVALVLTYEGATLRLCGYDLTSSLEREEEGYPIQFQKNNPHASDFQQVVGDPDVYCFTFGGGTLPGSALISVQTSFSEGETVYIYGMEDQYTFLLAEEVTVGKDGVVAYRSAFYGDTAISDHLQTAGLSILPDDGGDSGKTPPLWILLAGGGVLLLIGLGLGIGIKAVLHRRKTSRQAASGKNDVEPTEEIRDFFASPQPISNQKSGRYDEPLFGADKIPPLSDEYFDDTPDKPLRPKNGRRYRR